MFPYKKVAFYTLGCKLNFAETSFIARQFEKNGYTKVDFEDMADIYVINSCSVTENADKKCRQIISKALNKSPDAKIAVIGCYAQLNANEIASIKGVDIVLGEKDKFNIVKYVKEVTNNSKIIKKSHIKDSKNFVHSYSLNERTRAFLKVQDGCDYFCSFCTIPLARGRSRNPFISELIDKAKEISKKNIKEIVLTGVNIGDFGKSSNESFLELIKQLDKVKGIHRYRISSIEPNLLTNEIIDFIADSKKFVPHFHIPLQSGSNKILKLMRRKYDNLFFENKINYIMKKIPDACIGIDVIVGFPNENKNDFQLTYNFLNSLPFSYLHVFPYSERKNTTALHISNKVPLEIKKERSALLRRLSLEKKKNFYLKFKGKRRNVLFENNIVDGNIFGFTDNYIRVSSKFKKELVNKIIPVTLSNFEKDKCVYEV